MKLDDQTLRAAVREADSRYYDMVKRRIAETKAEAAARKGRHLMQKQKIRRITKYALTAVIAAAVLGAGGIAATVAMRGAHGGNNHTEQTVTVQSGLTLTNQEWNDLFCKSYGQYVSPQEHLWFAATDKGFYHEQIYRTEIRTDADGNYDGYGWLDWYENLPMNHGIVFTDSETGETLPLCARANCLHDGSDFCEASTKGYAARSALIPYGDALYALAAKRNDKGEYDAGYVLAYAPDGSGITELAHFDVHPKAELIGDPVLHRGCIFAIYKDYSYYGEETGDEVTGEIKRQISSGFVVRGYELASGKTAEIFRSMPGADEGKEYDVPNGSLLAAGDRLIFSYWHAKWPSALAKGTYAVNLVTGETKALNLIGDSASTGIYDVNGTELLYDGVQTVDGAQKGVLYAYDFETAESRMLPLGTSNLTRLMQCGEYYIAETYASHGTPNTERFTTYYTDTVFDSEWNQITSVQRPENAVFGNMMVHDGKLYQLYYYTRDPEIPVEKRQKSESAKLLCCDLSDLIAGDPHWETVFEFVTAEATYG